MARAQSEITDLTRERKKEREKKRRKKEKGKRDRNHFTKDASARDDWLGRKKWRDSSSPSSFQGRQKDKGKRKYVCALARIFPPWPNHLLSRSLLFPTTHAHLLSQGRALKSVSQISTLLNAPPLRVQGYAGMGEKIPFWFKSLRQLTPFSREGETGAWAAI